MTLIAPSAGLTLPADWDELIQFATDTELDELAVLLEEERLARERTWSPQPKQALASALAAKVDELLFGGAAGGGKTEWGIHYVIKQMEDHAHNRGAIFRRVHPSLARSVIPRCRAILAGGRAKWNGVEKTFTFPNGSILELSSLQYKETVHDFQGAEYGVIFFEEVTEFLESQWEFLITRLRAPAPGIRPHAIATTNPGGTGHTWVKRRWIKPRAEDFDGKRPQPFQVWGPKATDERPNPGKRVFVPSTLDDNQALLARDPGYRDRVRAIGDRGLRKAMETGDWDAIDSIAGALWTGTWLEAGRITRQQHAKTQVFRRVIAVDPSDGDEGGDEYGVFLGSRGMDGRAYVEGSWAWSMPVREMAKSTLDIYYKTNCDAIVVEKNHGGAWMLEVFRQIDRYANIVIVWASKGKVTRAEPVASLFQPDMTQPPLLRYRAVMVGYQDELEGELTTYSGAPGEASPNRLDALVWGVHDLIIKQGHTGQEQYTDDRFKGRQR